MNGEQQIDERQALFHLWEQHGSSWESHSDEGWELADAILDAGFHRTPTLTGGEREAVRVALEQNLMDSVGACTCDEAYTGRDLIDPNCGWHDAEGTADDESVDRVIRAFHRTVLGGSTRSAVKALTGATDVELDELGGFSDALSAMPVEPDLSALPEVQHRIEGGRFVCPGDAGSRCHQYPGCDCESWPCRHEYVAHDECWIKPWIDATDLCDSYAGREHDDLLRDGDFPDGDVLWSWEGDYVLWEYVTNRTMGSRDV